MDQSKRRDESDEVTLSALKTALKAAVRALLGRDARKKLSEVTLSAVTGAKIGVAAFRGVKTDAPAALSIKGRKSAFNAGSSGPILRRDGGATRCNSPSRSPELQASLSAMRGSREAPPPPSFLLPEYHATAPREVAHVKPIGASKTRHEGSFSRLRRLDDGDEPMVALTDHI